LKPEDLKAKSEGIRDKAKALSATISTAALEETASGILNVALRRKLVEDISKIGEDLAQQARKREQEIRDYSINEGKEVWVMFFRSGAQGATYYAHLMLAKSARDVAASMDGNYDTWNVRYDSFLRLIENLKREILEGNHDDALRTKPARANL
jgi:4-diphosphocytidyl-2C-methyl-D-erythritol kinase